MPMHVTRVFDAFAASPSGFDLRLALLAVVLSYAIFRYLQHCLEYRSETAYGIQNSCQPITATIPYRWPGGLDLLKRQYDANAAQELLAYQTPILEKFGPNLEIKLFGNSGYITLDPLNVEAVLSTRFKDYGLGSRSDGLFRFLGEGIFTQDGNKWRHSRELLRRPFMRIPYQNLEGFKEHLDDIISTLSTFAKKGATVDLQPLFFRFTLATTTALIFGQPVKSFDGEEQNSFSNGFDYASMISGLRIRLADLYFLYTPSRFKQACSDVRKYAFDFVQQALADTGNDNGVRDSKYAFIRDLYDELKDPELVRDQLVHVLIAGRDTTACLLSWTFFLLVRHPSVLQRLHQDIKSVLEDGETLTRAHIKRMNYLRHVLNETNRLYPQLPINVRFATKTTILPRGGGADGQSPLLIRKGMGIGTAVYHMHRRKSLYGPDAECFRPERWEGDDLADIGWGFLPFHGGPRQCLGKDFALMEASCAVVRILQTFPNIRLPPGYPIVPTGQEKQNLTLVVSSADGCKVLLS